MKNSINSRAFKIAHQIKSFLDSWKDALKAGWIIAKLFLGRAVNFTFAKKEGELREVSAIALGSLETLKKGFFRFVETLENGNTQWRSCRIERLVFDI